MAEQWQLRKGSTAENEGFIGAEGELTYDTTTKAVHVHDGETAGGALIDAVVAYQLPTSENGYKWYRKYASGWVEQGGISDASSSGVAVTMPITMLDVNYTVVVGNGNSTTNQDYTAWCGAYNRTVNGFTFYVKGYGGSGTSYKCCWQVSGIAA